MEAIIIFVKYLIIFAVSYYVITFLARLFRKTTYRITMTDSQANTQLYLLAIAGGYIPLLLIGGYVVLVEKDAWLKRVVIKALALMLLFSVILTVIGLIPDMLSWISGLASVFDGVFTYGKASAVVGVISGLIDIVRTVLFLVLGLNALKMKDVSIGWIDNMINRNR